ncbi:prolipoprotein diacylglyceryl transferase [Aerococcaceae bacterium DSM 111021]|nr:prolipoprotein diacylglyceryl transferase [Aerococcaceae bacterium DSM 111021]
MLLNLLAIDPIAFEILGWPVRWYGVIIGLAILIGYILFTREASRKGIDSDTSFDLLFWTVIFGLVGARIYYVIFSSQSYLSDPLSVFRVWEGGMAIYGGVIGGALTIYILCQKYKINVIDVFDTAVPALMAGQLIGRWGNFMNQEAHGGSVSKSFLEDLSLPNFIIEQMNINGTYYHPTFLYESLWNLVGLVILLILRPRKKLFKQGELVAFYMIWYGIGRFWIEGLRTDSLFIGPLRVSQILSLILIFVGLGIVFWTRVKGKENVPFYTDNRLPILRNEEVE